MRRVLPLIVLLCGLTTGTSQAAFYVGASYLSIDSEFETAFEDFDADDSAWKGYAGFTFFKFLAFEASYRDLGTHKDIVKSSSIIVDLESFDASVRGVLPLGKRISLFIRAGYANITREGEVGSSGSPLISFDEDDWEAMYGAGIDIQLGNHFGVRAEWEEYDVDGSLNSFSAGAFFRF